MSNVQSDVAKAFTAEALAAKAIYEITINYPSNDKDYKIMDIPQKIQIYKMIWRKVIPPEYKYDYWIEYTKKGEPHLHGYFYIPICEDSDEKETMMIIVKNFYKCIPRKYYNQIEKNPYNEYYKRFKAPFLCVNHKRVLHHQWLNYCQKDQSRSDLKT